MDDHLCCLCRSSLAKDRRRRRKLHGQSCSSLKEQLQDLSSVPLASLVETADDNAYLCNSCEKQLTSIAILEAKLAELRSGIRASLSTLHSVLGTPIDTLRKRRLEGADYGHPAQKQSRMVPAVVFSSSSQLDHPRTPTRPPTGTRLGRVEETLPGSSPEVQVNISYQSGVRKIKVHTPNRKRGIKSLARGSYKSLVSMMLSAPASSRSVIAEMARKILTEMNSLSSSAHDSFLRSTVDAVKNFSWDKVMSEFTQTVPTLMMLLECLVPKPAEKKPFMCFVASLLLKCRHQRMGLVQRAVSIMLYGNGSSKQLYHNLQPLNVCMSYRGTLNLVEKLCVDHDAKVRLWAAEIKDKILIPQEQTAGSSRCPPFQRAVCTTLSQDSSDDECSAPVCSPLSPAHSIPSDFSGQIWPDAACVDDVEDLLSGVDEDFFADDIFTEFEESTSAQLEDAAAAQLAFETPCLGYRLVGDNIDKTVKPSLQRHESKGQSLHHFHSYSVKDRVAASLLSDVAPKPCTPDPEKLLPSSVDVKCIKQEMAILLSRIIHQHLDDFKDQSKEVVRHIPSQHSKEMATKSEVIPMGVLLHNENKLDEMSKILAHFMQFVPTLSKEGELSLPNGGTLSYDDTEFFKLLLGGDQLTAVRIRGTQALRVTQDEAVDRLEGLIPVAEDWHSRMAVVDAIWKRFFRVKSVQEKGTLYQLRNLINRTSVPTDPTKNMNAAEDFLLLLLHAHAVAAAKAILSHNPTDSLEELSRRIVVNFVVLPSTEKDKNQDIQELPICEDEVYLYGTEFLSLSLIWHGFHDAIKEGDGDRILRYWKFMLIIFKSSAKKNYGKEAVNFLAQYYYFFSDRQKEQLLWSRCVNTKGYQGTNIPGDLHMEHLNRRLKTAMRNLGANIKPVSIERAGKCVGVVQHVCQTFEEQTSSQHSSDRHPIPALGKDFFTILKILEEESVFVPQCKRKHDSFDMKKSLMDKFTRKQLCTKIKNNIDQIYFT